MLPLGLRRAPQKLKNHKKLFCFILGLILLLTIFWILSNRKPVFQPVLVQQATYTIGIVSHRPNELKNLLASLKGAGVQPELVYLFDDSPGPESKVILESFGGNLIDKQLCSDKDALRRGKYRPLTARYWCLFNYLFTHTKLGSKVDSIIVLEDDLIVSPDFITYFEKLLPIMMREENTFCISAWNDHGWPSHVSDPKKLWRQNHFGGLGWAMDRQRWKLFVEAHEYQMSLAAWDSQMDTIFNSNPHHTCIHPEVPRTHHNPLGDMYNRLFQLNWFENMKLNKEKVPIDIESITEPKYDRHLSKLIESGIFVSCRDDILSYEDSVILIVVKALSNADQGWRVVGNQFSNMGIWAGPKQMRTVYKGVYSTRWGSNLVLFVGTYSPFVRELSNKFKGHLDVPEGFDIMCRDGPIRSQAWRDSSLFETVRGDPNLNCNQVCHKSQRKCEERHFHHLIQDLAHHHTFPRDSCQDTLHSFAYPYAQIDGVVIINQCSRWYSCEGVPPMGASRICPCSNFE